MGSGNSFHNEHSKPTDQQYLGIGKVTANWALAEDVLEDILARLALSPTYFGRALTNDLGIDNRIRALRNLCDVHEFQLGCRMVSKPVIENLRQAAKQIAALKETRNQIVHYVWLRQTDDRMLGIRFRTKPAATGGGASISKTVAELIQFALEVESLTDNLLSLADQLPEIQWP